MDQRPDADQRGVPTSDPLEHTQVLAALARLASRGVWTRVLGGQEPDVDRGDDDLDVADVDLLVHAGVLGRDEGRLRLLRDETWLRLPEAVANAPLARLVRAVEHATGADPGWCVTDPRLLTCQGRSSHQAAILIAEGLLALMPQAREAFEAGRGRFLDVGTGVGTIAIELCQQFPGLRATGIDVLPEALDLARREVDAAGLAGRVDLRLQSVADLSEDGVYDLAWLPQPFIPPDPFRWGVKAVHEALRPDGWLVVPLMAGGKATVFDQKAWEHSQLLLGGGATTPETVAELLDSTSFTDVDVHPVGPQTIVVGRKV